MSDHDDKPGKFFLELLVSRMHELQSGSSMTYRNDEIFRNKLLNVVKDVDACKLAYCKPADSAEELISDLHSLLTTESTPQNPAVDAYFVDRKYRGQRERHYYARESVGNNEQNHGRSHNDLR